MLLEDNGLLPFLEDWRSLVEPKMKSITVFIFCPNIFVYRYTSYTDNQSSYQLYLRLFSTKTLYELAT